MKQQVEYYTKQDVLDAEWVVQTSETLDHGTPTLLWAWRIINWYIGMYQNVVFLVKKRHMDIINAFDRTIFLIKNNLFNPLKGLVYEG